MEIQHVVSRYYCPTHQDIRVYPFDGIELAVAAVYKTLAPVTGKKGGGILLRTANGTGHQHRFAWCWLCEQFVEATRVTQHELVLRYLERRGVHFRVASGTRPAPVERMLEARREERA